VEKIGAAEGERCDRSSFYNSELDDFRSKWINELAAQSATEPELPDWILADWDSDDDVEFSDVDFQNNPDGTFCEPLDSNIRGANGAGEAESKRKIDVSEDRTFLNSNACELVGLGGADETDGDLVPCLAVPPCGEAQSRRGPPSWGGATSCQELASPSDQSFKSFKKIGARDLEFSLEEEADFDWDAWGA